MQKLDHTIVEESVDAEFVDDTSNDGESTAEATDSISQIRRSPQALDNVRPATNPEKSARISMDLDEWLVVDRKMHELYNLCEIAIMQRDEARDEVEMIRREKGAAEDHAQVAKNRLKEWKGYASKLEKRVHAEQIEGLALNHTARRILDLAEEALEVGPLALKRRARLREKLEEMREEVTP